MIKAPYNFVPVNEQVFFPDWADKISLDKPFSDGVSGSIKLKITARSPIFVRNGHLSKEDPGYVDFCNVDGKYFIPATTMKGMIRNALSILSYGRMSIDKNLKFAQREWDNDNLYTLKKEQLKLSCGWLKCIDNRFYILDCGRPLRIGHDVIDNHAGSKILRSNFSKDYSKIDLNSPIKIGNKEFDPKTGCYKYEILKNVKLTGLRFKHLGSSDTRVVVDSNGSIEGDIVLTGQPSEWMYPRPTKLNPKAGKFYEFVFKTTEQNNNTLIEISEDTFKQYKSIYKDNPDWDRAYSDLEGKGIPVFFRKNKKEIKDFGLAFLYKLPYDHSPYELLSKDHKVLKHDLAECMFGRIDSDKSSGLSLKGRVHVGHAFSGNAKCEELMELVLGSPKASYYPSYIKQEGKGSVNTYNTYNSGILSGRKQYIRRDAIWQKSMNNDNVDTKLRPLKAGTIFESVIRFHNLRPIELGALISAISFHNNEDSCFHMIGQGKPYGLGKITINATINNLDENDQIRYMALFEDCMNRALNRNWISTDSIQEFFHISHCSISDNTQFKYMELDVTNSKNEFVEAKKNREFLAPFSSLIRKNFVPKSLYADYQAIIEAERAEEEARIAAERAEELRQKELKALELKRMEQEELEKNRAQRINSGMAFLEEKNLKDEYKVYDWKGANTRIEKWLKDSKNNVIPDNEINILFSSLKRLKSTASKKDLKDWENPKSSIWTKISRWTNDKVTIDMFEE